MLKFNLQDSFSYNSIIMKKTIYITIVLLFSFLSILGQSNATKEADTYFENLSYVSAAKEYKKLASNKKTAYVLKKLGDSYYLNAQMKEASNAYAQLFNAFVPQDPEYLFKYAQTLRAIGNFKESIVWMERFHQLKKEDSRGKKFINKDAILSDLRNNKPDYRIQNLYAINTEFSDFGVTEYRNTILFSSPRGRSKFVKKVDKRNERNFLDIYQVDKNEIGSKGNKKYFSNEINEIYHESSISFSPDNKTMYFTRNNYNNGDFNVDKKGYNNLKIYKSEFIDNKWKNIEEMPFCSNEYSVGHPTVSKDGKLLYFVSNMPGGIGKTDIYFVKIENNGTYSIPQNLGPEINTEGREMFPYISEDNTLYFSSDGHFGIGSLDVFSSKKVKSKFQKPVNLKYPINSKLDDFAFSINPITKKGYLSSNREGGMGDDDIYAIEQIVEDDLDSACIQDISGVVRESKFKKTLPYAKLTLKDALGSVIKETAADSLGVFSFKLPCDQKYAITASKEYYTPDTEYFETTDEVAVVLNLDFSLEIIDDFAYNSLNELVIKINSIYFDYNKWDIRPDAAAELDHIVDVMNRYPNLNVESTSHTDSRGRASYNQLLSQRRAESTVDYIIYNGIDSYRIKGKGYGESKLTNKCIDNDSHTNTVRCREVQHQENRRTAFVILNVDGTRINSEDKVSFKDEIPEEEDVFQEKRPKINLRTHVVGRGETLYFIARKYSLSVGLLRRINNLDSNEIYLNQVLLISHEQENNGSSTTGSIMHTVKPQQTLFFISKKYGVSVRKLKRINGLTSNNIVIGQILKIK